LYLSQLRGPGVGVHGVVVALPLPSPAGHQGLDRGAPIRQADAMTDPIDLPAALASLDEPWSPRTVAVLNDYDIRVVKTKGEFTRHRHLETDEVFLVLSGSLTIRLDDDEVTLGPGQLYVVPRGVHHQPVSVDGANVVLIEPSVTINTGDTPSHLTAARRARLMSRRAQ
jgi:mannose-6-phosphate isomerase-like protein (cupin superfamily)